MTGLAEKKFDAPHGKRGSGPRSVGIKWRDAALKIVCRRRRLLGTANQLRRTYDCWLAGRSDQLQENGSCSEMACHSLTHRMLPPALFLPVDGSDQSLDAFFSGWSSSSTVHFLVNRVPHPGHTPLLPVAGRLPSRIARASWTVRTRVLHRPTHNEKSEGGLERGTVPTSRDFLHMATVTGRDESTRSGTGCVREAGIVFNHAMSIWS